ncbi:MAG: ATP-dependent Clp protease ATP-binding subunit [Lachnospiraceae bacterium]|nr:ATP-dependent Clp protease ATP-binding subunit [Lachnospiraceae bacterium]
MFDRFTRRAKEVLEEAREAAEDLDQNYVGTEHLLLGMLRVESCAAAQLLNAHGVTEKKLVDMISRLVAPANSVSLKEPDGYSPSAYRAIENSCIEAKRLKCNLVGSEHILIAILKIMDCAGTRLLTTMKVNIRQLYLELISVKGGEPSLSREEAESFGSRGHSTKTPQLDQYSTDLTVLAREGKLDPVIGREREIARVIQILSRRTKNNPCLIGEPGVGKTAVAEGLASEIISGNVPDSVRGKRVVTLDLAGMIAGSKYRGEFEERMKNIIQEVRSDGEILLFIDELHTIIDAGGAEGAMNASNILKPCLARGEIQIIGATTIDEYRKHVEKDAALERRFQPVMIDEPSEEETAAILKGLRHAYEEHHKVEITDDAVMSAVKLSARYINDRFLPDKAIDLIDEAASKVRLGAFVAPEEITRLEKEVEALSVQKEEAIKQEAFEQAGEIKKKQERKQEKIRKLTEKWKKEKEETRPQVTSAEIADVVAMWTKIPVRALEESEAQRLRDLEKILHERVIGQEEAVSAVSKAIRRGRVGLKDPKRPIGSFLFLGPTGVGKTELSKALAQAMFGTEQAIIRVDMSEYMEKHSVSKLIGSPPGYVGYEEGGQLSEKIRRNPYSVLLFDEIEKAHPDVFNILLQVLDDGQITDSQGRRVSFKNTVIIMTSNCGAQNIMTPKRLGFGVSEDAKADYDFMKNRVMDEVKQNFKPEFLNRIDEIIVFHPLNKDHMKEIFEIMAAGIVRRVKEQMEITLKISEEARDFLIDAGYDSKYGARPMRRALQSKLEDTMAEAILEGTIQKGDTVTVTTADGKLVYKTRHRRKTATV